MWASLNIKESVTEAAQNEAVYSQRLKARFPKAAEPFLCRQLAEPSRRILLSATFSHPVRTYQLTLFPFPPYQK